MALQLLMRCRRAKTEVAAKKVAAEVVEQVAAKLGNTVAVCRKCYIHPGVFDRYLEGRLSNGKTGKGQVPAIRDVKRPLRGLASVERDALKFLRGYLRDGGMRGRRGANAAFPTSRREK